MATWHWVYTAVDEHTAKEALHDFADSEWGQKYPHAYTTWFSAWDRFIPFLGFPPELRRGIYTTNSIESLNYQLRKVRRTGGISRTTPR